MPARAASLTDRESSGGAIQGVQNTTVLGELALTEGEWLRWTARLSSTVKSAGKIKTKVRKQELGVHGNPGMD